MPRVLALLCFLTLAATPAAAAPAPFVSYHSPAGMCDELPVSARCAAAERQHWRKFLNQQMLPHFAHITSVRLTDLFFPNAIHGGWVFKLVAPVAPPRWQKLEITVGGIAVGINTRDWPYNRHVQLGSLVVEIAIERTQLAPGKHRVEAKDGDKIVFAFDLVLEDGAPNTPDLTKALADDAAAAKRPAFLVAALPTKPACNVEPKPAGCHRSVKAMWSGLFTNTLAGLPHTKSFAKKSRPDAAGNPIWHWNFHLVFPTSPPKWLHSDLEVQLDRKPAPYSHRYKQIGTEALLVELTLLEAGASPGKHEVRAIDRATGTVFFSSEIELVK